MTADVTRTTVAATVCRLLALCAICLASVAADPAEKDEGGDAAKDTAALKGKWEPTSSESGGNRDDESDYKQFRLVFEGDKFTILKSGETHMKGSVKIDAAQTPKKIDLVVEECPDPDIKGKSLLGIFELKGEELKWCFVPPDNGDRPKEFSSQSGTSQILATFKREK